MQAQTLSPSNFPCLSCSELSRGNLEAFELSKLRVLRTSRLSKFGESIASTSDPFELQTFELSHVQSRAVQPFKLLPFKLPTSSLGGALWTPASSIACPSHAHVATASKLLNWIPFSNIQTPNSRLFSIPKLSVCRTSNFSFSKWSKRFVFFNSPISCCI